MPEMPIKSELYSKSNKKYIPSISLTAYGKTTQSPD